MAFNAKNLAYENKQPAFLQRLRNQYGDTSGRLERPVARPRLAKTDNDDDEPTYVFEESNETITKEEYEALLRGDTEQDDSTKKSSSDQDLNTPASNKTEKPESDELSTTKQNVAEIGGPKKRKQAKIIADESAEPDTGSLQGKSDSQKVKQKQKKKKIKLSFDD